MEENISPSFVCGLLLPFLVLDNALLCRASIELLHAGLSTVLSPHVLPTFQIICFRHWDFLLLLIGALVERHFSSSIVTATSAFAESLTLLPSTPATRLLSMK